MVRCISRVHHRMNTAMFVFMIHVLFSQIMPLLCHLAFSASISVCLSPSPSLCVCLLFVCQSVCVSVRLSETRKRRFTGERFREARLGVCVSSPRSPYIIIHISYSPPPPPPASSQPCLLSSPPPRLLLSLSLPRDGAPRMKKINEAPFGKSPELSKVPTVRPGLGHSSRTYALRLLPAFLYFECLWRRRGRETPIYLKNRQNGSWWLVG